MARRLTRAPNWTPPPDEQLVVLRAQVAEAIADGSKLLAEPFDQGRWYGWEVHVEDLLTRAFGPEHWPKEFRETTGGSSFAVVQDVDDYYGDADEAKTRNEIVSAKLGVVRGALKAVDQELERRGAQSVESGLPARDFAFVRFDELRAIAARDYDELRTVGGSTVKAAALLAGSVVEAVISDALLSQGFTAKQLDEQRFVELIDEAAAAKVIREHTQKAAHAVRDVRNFVHPAVELREGRLRKVDAGAAIALMQMVLEDLA